MAGDGKHVQALEDMPELDLDLVLFWEAFYELTNARQYSMGGPQPLANTEIVAWMDIHEIENRTELYQFVRHLDTHWMRWAREEQERKRADAKRSNQRGKS
jgi:hypothetical protein